MTTKTVDKKCYTLRLTAEEYDRLNRIRQDSGAPFAHIIHAGLLTELARREKKMLKTTNTEGK